MRVKLKPWYVSEHFVNHTALFRRLTLSQNSKIEKQTAKLHHQMEDPCQGKSLLKAKDAILPMYDREALHHHQIGTGNIKQMK